MATDRAPPRVELVSIDPDARERIFRWYQDPELVAPFDRYETEQYSDFLESLEAAAGDPRSLAPRYAIRKRSDGALLGCVGHYLAHPVLEFVDVWYVLGVPGERGHGYGTEAVGLLIDRVYSEYHFERVGATCDVENIGSARLLETLGLRREGTMRSALFHHGTWHDIYVYGTTRAEWTRLRSPAHS